MRGGAKTWLLNLFNHCLETYKIPKIWRKSRVIAVPRPGKDQKKGIEPSEKLLAGHTGKASTGSAQVMDELPPGCLTGGLLGKKEYPKQYYAILQAKFCG